MHSHLRTSHDVKVIEKTVNVLVETQEVLPTYPIAEFDSSSLNNLIATISITEQGKKNDIMDEINARLSKDECNSEVKKILTMDLSIEVKETNKKVSQSYTSCISDLVCLSWMVLQELLPNEKEAAVNSFKSKIEQLQTLLTSEFDPHLHAFCGEDTEWAFLKIIPYVYNQVMQQNKYHVSLFDIGTVDKLFIKSSKALTDKVANIDTYIRKTLELSQLSTIFSKRFRQDETHRQAALRADKKSESLSNKECIVNLLYYAWYIEKNKNDAKNKAYYANDFMKYLFRLKANLGGSFNNHMAQWCDLTGDWQFLRAIPFICNEAFQHEFVLEDFRRNESIALDIMYQYAEAKDQGRLAFDSVEIKDQTNQVVLDKYLIRDIVVKKDMNNDIAEPEKGLVGVIFIPQYKDNEVPEHPEIIIAWAGTHNEATRKIDAERNAGVETFLVCEDQISRQIVMEIEKVYAQYKRPIVITNVGHSLGGSLAQYVFFASLRGLMRGMRNAELERFRRKYSDDNPIPEDTLAASFQGKYQKESDEFVKSLKMVSKKFDLSRYNSTTHGVFLNPEIIAGLKLNVYGDAGVIKPVEESSNRICQLIRENTKIKIKADFSYGENDIIAGFGQGRILSDVVNNHATVNVLMINSGNKLGIFSVVVGVVGGAVGAVAFGPGIAATFFFTGSLTGLGLTAKVSREEHSSQHFAKRKQPENPYRLYQSHVNQLLNDDAKKGAPAIQKMLSDSSYLVDLIFEYVIGPNAEPRRVREEHEHIQAFKLQLTQLENEANDNFNNIMAHLHAEMKSMFQGKNLCIKYAISYFKNHSQDSKRKDLLNYQDAAGKTLLHHAIECGNCELASQLLDEKNLNLELADHDGNTPFLLLMKVINKTMNDDVYYELGLKLLGMIPNINAEDNKKVSPKSIFNSWTLYGFGVTRRFCEMMKQKIDDERLVARSAPGVANAK